MWNAIGKFFRTLFSGDRRRRTYVQYREQYMKEARSPLFRPRRNLSTRQSSKSEASLKLIFKKGDAKTYGSLSVGKSI